MIRTISDHWCKGTTSTKRGSVPICYSHLKERPPKIQINRLAP